MGRFGNNLIQAVNAVALAKAHDIPVIYHSFGWLLRRYSTPAGPLMIRVRPCLLSSRSGVWAGLFSNQSASALRELGSKGFAECAMTQIQPGIPWVSKKAEKKLITVNIRGGDVMLARPNPPKVYVQPPLAFYTVAIKRLMAETGKKGIGVIFEDRANPVLDALEFWALEQGIVCVEHSDRSFASDSKRLLAAEHLIAGYSWFSDSLAILSGNLKSFTYFRQGFKTKAIGEKGVRVYRGNDPDESFIRPRTWENTVAQRKQLVDYPEDKIVIEEVSVGQPDQ